jgi:hypothetical protein
MKKYFFNANVHEIAHISAERIKFDTETRKHVENFLRLVKQGDKIQANEYKRRYKRIFGKYEKTSLSEYKGH